MTYVKPHKTLLAYTIAKPNLNANKKRKEFQPCQASWLLLSPLLGFCQKRISCAVCVQSGATERCTLRDHAARGNLHGCLLCRSHAGDPKIPRNKQGTLTPEATELSSQILVRDASSMALPRFRPRSGQRRDVDAFRARSRTPPKFAFCLA